MKIPRYMYIQYQDRLNSSAFSQVAVRHFGNVLGEFDALATSGTARKLQVSLYSTSEVVCGEILAF